MKIVPLVLVVAALAQCSGCARRPDSIEPLIVTVDVTGTREGMGGNLELKLEQEGPKVTGSMVWRGLFGTDAGASGSALGSVEGTVTWDVFEWKQTSGAIRVSESQMKVNGDEMNGRLRVGSGSFLAMLRRTDAARPSSR
ncbi:MAG TPA: hypothetical protein VMS64_16630 [Candidatus Methylomirabilis sp.]|nr:hypothetical protein [Candidatus Methylomirabilis sp.]